MKEIHYEWTERQLGNLLYWQKSVQKSLVDYIIKKFYHDNNEIYLLFCGSGLKNKLISIFQDNIYSMESAGIDVFNTLRNNNIDFELKPKNIVILTNLICLNKRISGG